ncbi:MAG: TIGR04283 family arsenosugar biosynthesis glycosyltransferase [Thermacetogeniaceae bacterium]
MISSGVGSKISVIIPTLNEEIGIGALLESLSSRPDLEIIVSDGGSADRTEEICRTCGVTFIAGHPCRGRQMNAGAKIASGEILLFLHADSSLEGRVLDEVRNAVSNGKRWGCCTFGFNENCLFFKVLAAICRWRVLLSSICYGDQGIYCTRELFRRVNGFPDLPLFEDRVFSGRMRRVGRAFVVQGRITTSTRRFRKRGLWSMLWKSQLLKLMFMLGVSPYKLSSMYQQTGDAKVCQQQP